jgi:hypothetical protein
MLTTLIPIVASAIALATAVLSYGMSRKAHSLSVRTADRQNARSRSEETMRLLRWAVELATDPNVSRCVAGVAALQALDDAHVVLRADRAFVHAVAAAVVAAADDEFAYSEDDQGSLDIAATSQGGQSA